VGRPAGKKLNEEIYWVKREYETSYASKPAYVNKLSVINANECNLSYDDQYKKMTGDCLGIVNELNENYSQTTIYKESITQNGPIRYNVYIQNYEPVIDSFMILSLGKYRSDDNNTYTYLNLAFDISWDTVQSVGVQTDISDYTTYSDISIESDQEEDQDQGSTENGQLATSQPAPAIGNNMLEWKFIEENPSSYRSYLMNQETGWRIPSREELKRIISKDSNWSRLNQSIFGTASFPSTIDRRIIIVTNESTRNEYNKKVLYAIQVLDNQYNTKEITVEEGKMVYVILIKK